MRRERFVEELESYQKQVEEFATYGDMNEIQKYLRKSQNLETKLTAAAEKVGLQFGSLFIFYFICSWRKSGSDEYMLST